MVPLSFFGGATVEFSVALDSCDFAGLPDSELGATGGAEALAGYGSACVWPASMAGCAPRRKLFGASIMLRVMARKRGTKIDVADCAGAWLVPADPSGEATSLCGQIISACAVGEVMSSSTILKGEGNSDSRGGCSGEVTFIAAESAPDQALSGIVASGITGGAPAGGRMGELVRAPDATTRCK